MLRWLKRWGPWIVLLACVLLVADEALAQSTGGRFGGGSFGGGGSSGGGSYGGGGSDGGDGLITFVIYVLLSRLPLPLKLGLVGVAVAIFVGVKVVRRTRKGPPEDPPGGG